MELDELKTEWQKFNKKLNLSQHLNEQLIHNMLRERSRSRISKIRRENTFLMIWMGITMLFLIAIFLGNPFDFKYMLQFVPYVMLAAGVLMAMISLYKSMMHLRGGINDVSLDAFLKKTIDGFERNKKFEKWFAILLFGAGVLTTLSFLPKKLEHKGIWTAVGETAISMVITLAVYFVAYKLGLFKNRNKTDFESDLKEFNELKAILKELE